MIFLQSIQKNKMAKSEKKYYVVWKGHRPGVYHSWDACKKSIDGFDGAIYKSFPNLTQANVAYGESPYKYIGTKQSVISTKKVIAGAISYPSLAVDAACSGNPGLMEYRGVDCRSKKEIFHQGPYRNGTNNIGEFLGLVHGLAWCKQNNLLELPIYTDSMTALAWVNKKCAKTKLEETADNEILFELIGRAEAWLKNNSWKNPIIKWETQIWGEIPADFGGK